MMSSVVWIRLEDPTMILFFPSLRVVGFSFSLSSSSFESAIVLHNAELCPEYVGKISYSAKVLEHKWKFV